MPQANHLTDFKDVELEKQQAKKVKESEEPCSSNQLTMQESIERKQLYE